MKLGDWLRRWEMTGLRVQPAFLEQEWAPRDKDKDAAWALYVELLTRFTPQPFEQAYGDEAAALESIHSLFPITRQLIKEQGRECAAFTKIAVVVLNQLVRPFIAKWHAVSLNGGFEQPAMCEQFRSELEPLQQSLRRFARMLSDMAEVEDLTALEAA